MFTPTPPAQSLPASASNRHSGHTDHVVQRIADGAIWLVFRLDGVRS